MKVLITSGATREAIDGVRYVTNFSTGRTGSRIGEEIIRSGHEVLFFGGRDSQKPKSIKNFIQFDSFDDLNRRLKIVLGEERFDVVIHLAAVSDYSVAEVLSGGKLYSDGINGKVESQNELSIKMRRNFKILERLKNYSQTNKPIVVGFKLTNTNSKEERLKAVSKIYLSGQVDFVVHNDLSDIGDDFHHFRIIDKEFNLFECDSAEILTQKLLNLLGGSK